MSTCIWPPKDPTETKDYDLDFTLMLLNGDIIETSVWSITDGDADLEINSNSFSSPFTKVWLSAGTLGLKYTLRNIVTTAQLKTYTQSVTLLIKAK